MQSKQATLKNEEVSGAFQHVIYSPHGTVEGAMLAGADGTIQLVVSHDEDGSVFHHMVSGALVVAVADFVGWSTVKAAGHRVYTLGSIKTVDGKKPVSGKGPKRKAAYSGKVARLNYARHGEPNGVVLDSGDFIHLKPDGFKKLKLKIGDAVEVDGDGYQLDAVQGYVVEATRVNGKSLS